MSKLLDHELLKTLVAVADSGTFVRAAARVHRTQSAISMQMRRLETAVGVPLFARSGRGLRLTSRGELLVAYARRIIRLQDEAWNSIAQPGITGSLCFGIPEDYVEAVLPPVLDRFAAAYPLVELEVRCEPSHRLVPLVSAGEIDLALITRAPERSRSESLRREPLLWAAAPQFTAQLDEPIPVALFQPGCLTRQHVVEALSGAGIRYRAAYSSPSLAGLLAVTRAGLAVTALPRCSVPADLRIFGISDGFPPLPPLELALLRRSGANAASAALAEALLAELQHNVRPAPREAEINLH